MDNFTDVWGIGPEMDPAVPGRALFKFAAYVAVVIGLVWIWDPESHVLWVYLLFDGRWTRNFLSMVSRQKWEAEDCMNKTIILGNLTYFTFVYHSLLRGLKAIPTVNCTEPF